MIENVWASLCWLSIDEMELSKFLFLISIFCRVSLTEPTHSEEHEDAFHSIVNTLELNETLRLEDVNLILTQLDLRHCSNATNKCVTAESLFKIFNISNTSSVGEEEFSKFAPIIVYALLPSEHHSDDDEDKDDHHHDDHDEDDHDDHAHDEHDHDDHAHDEHDHDKDDHDKEDDHDEDHDHDEDGEKEITQNVNVYEELLERYQTGVLCEQVIDQLLNDVNQTKGQPGNQCFSSDDIFHERNISNDSVLGKSRLPVISVSIVSRLIQKQCIEVRYQSPLPCSSYFGNKLFHEYAENDVISKEKMEELLKKLKLGDEHDEEHHESEHDEEHHDHDDHDHRRRRSLKIAVDPLQSQFQENELRSQRRYRREAIHEHRNESTKYQKCYSVDELFAIYHVDRKTGFTQEKFERLTSALLQQIESEVCEKKTPHEHKDDVDSKKKWGYGILTVLIISLCSLVGVAIIPFMDKVIYYKAVVFLISLAVGTLVGDALLHLFPHALAFHAGHDHGHDGHDSETGENEDRDYLWKFLVASAAIYGFFLFETLTHLFFRKSIAVGHSHSHELEHTRKHSQFSGHEHEYGQNAAEECVVESGYGHKGNMPVVLTNVAYMNDEELANSGNQASAMNEKKTPRVFENGSNSNKSSEVREKGEVKKEIASVAWNIIIGDTIHNVADGIAIGVAFSNSITGGVSTAIAVFCHELPHELGDFAVLLSAGMSVKQAVLANFLSACSCFIGFIFGVLISEFEDVNLWIFALTGGFFLYVALTNMLPELMHSDDFSVIPKLSRFLLQNLGILTGFGLMFLLSYYEEDINV